MLPFFGMQLTSAYRVQLSNQTVNSVATTPADSTAGYRLATDGKEYNSRSQVGGGAYAEITGTEWLDPHDATEADGYECQATVTSGSLTSGTAGSWLALSSDRTWEKTRTDNALGTDTCVFTLEIRRVGTSVVLASGQITLNAEVA